MSDTTGERLTAETIAEIRQRHRQRISYDEDDDAGQVEVEEGYCVECCNDEYPCEVIRLLDHIAAIEAERDRLQAMVNRVIEGRGYVADDDEFIAMLDAHDAATRAEEGE